MIERWEIEGGYLCFYLVTRRSNLTPNLACTVSPHHPNEMFGGLRPARLSDIPVDDMLPPVQWLVIVVLGGVTELATQV